MDGGVQADFHIQCKKLTDLFRDHVLVPTLNAALASPKLDTVLVDDVLAANPDKVADAKTKPAALGWFVGQVMKASQGKANPQAVNALLKPKLGL